MRRPALLPKRPALCERRRHHFFRILFIDLEDLWTRLLWPRVLPARLNGWKATEER